MNFEHPTQNVNFSMSIKRDARHRLSRLSGGGGQQRRYRDGSLQTRWCARGRLRFERFDAKTIQEPFGHRARGGRRGHRDRTQDLTDARGVVRRDQRAARIRQDEAL